MESAIPPHLRCPRSREARASQDYNPPYPAWVARMEPKITQVVMGYFGVQFKGEAHAAPAADAMTYLLEHFAIEGGPRHHDMARCTDERGFETLIAIAYWDDPAVFQRWIASPSLAQWWADPQRGTEGIGHFREIVRPRATHLETLFSTTECFEGVGLLASGLSDEIQEHGYWGAARDRLPISQTDGLRASGAVSAAAPAPGQRVVVRSNDNLALIRSGQEWTQTSGKERDLYLREVEPVLREGMDFLRDQGATIGCYANRYMQLVDGSGRALEKSFGMSFWKSLEHMERWAESHPTHVAIFGNFMKMVQAMNFDLKLRLYHEVCVVKPDEQAFEYVNCHPGTGLPRAMG